MPHVHLHREHFADPKNLTSAAEVFAGLRAQAFAVDGNDVGAHNPRGAPSIWGLIMETGYPKGVASLVTFSDGTTSMYFSNGGGVIGAGQHVTVRAASKELLRRANTYIKEFTPAADHPLPAVGRVRFYARTFGGLLSADAEENELGGGHHRLSPLFYAAHQVIAELRQIAQAKGAV